MLYVFHVDTGCMMTFDMSLAVESVTHLRQQIESVCRIPADKQVLLVSGGQSLDPNARVCSYSSGTDTNPIFLFSKLVIESTVPPMPSSEYGPDIDFREKVKELHDLPPTYNTVVQRSQLAQQFHELAKEQMRICEGLVHDQHLQHQGWAAVIANLEDITTEFRKRSEILEKNFSEYINEREPYFQFLREFHRNLETLAKIPILPTLLSESESDSMNVEGSVEETIQEKKTDNRTLLEWISSVDDKSSMHQLFEHCSKGLEQFNQEVFRSLRNTVETVYNEATNVTMKEIKGLEDRLSGLEQLMIEAKRYVQEQADLAQSFLQNQTRASNIGDASILPDLCASHKKQLLVMSANYQQLCDIKRRCLKAKDELSSNLNHRLKWVMYVENVMLDIDHKLVIHHESLRRLRRNLEVLQQIHLAPATYLSAVAEVVRRRAFSQAFLAWASELACYLLTIHNEELSRRKDFQVQFEGHFLTSLFPGMEDSPPNFATQAPSVFDSNLPRLTVEDIEMLKSELPELTENMSVPDISAIANIFMLKSFIKSDVDKVDDRGVEEKLVQVVTEVGLASNLDHNLLKPAESETCLLVHNLPHLKDLDRGCESETDTEEFEKVGQSPMELNFDKNMPRTHDVSTLTEVGDKSVLPPRKPPRAFQKPPDPAPSQQLQKTMSFSGSNTESFTNIKNPSLESIDELSSMKNFNSNTESCFNSHHQQMQSFASRSKSLSPHTPQSPRDAQLSPSSPLQGHQHNEFANDEFYIDESLPSSLSIEAGQSQGEFVRQLDTVNNVVALLQDNLQTSRSEHDRLRALVFKMSELAKEAVNQLRMELEQLKCYVVAQRDALGISGLSYSWENLALEYDRHEQEALQKITNEYEHELDEFRQLRTVEVGNLRTEIQVLQEELREKDQAVNELMENLNRVQNSHELEIKTLQHEVETLKVQKEKESKELIERLTRGHKAELDSMRQRYRLMASTKMERSPSDPNLDLDRDLKDCNHEAMLMQMKENCDLEKEEAVAREAQKWERIMNEKLYQLEANFKMEKENLVCEVQRKIAADKEKQIDTLVERETNLQLECIKLKNTIQQFAENEAERQNLELNEKIKLLNCEKKQLQEQINLEKSRVEMATSIGKTDAATSPVKYDQHTSHFHPSCLRMLTIDTCRTGDFVLVYWDSTYKNYRVLQDNTILFFLHSDCLEPMGLLQNENQERKMYCPAEVVTRDYCNARKEENRYNVPVYTKFFRVTVKPLPSLKELKRKMTNVAPKEQDAHMSRSENICQSDSKMGESSETVASKSVPVTPAKQSPTDMDASVCTSPVPDETQTDMEVSSKSVSEGIRLVLSWFSR